MVRANNGTAAKPARARAAAATPDFAGADSRPTKKELASNRPTTTATPINAGSRIVSAVRRPTVDGGNEYGAASELGLAIGTTAGCSTGALATGA